MDASMCCNCGSSNRDGHCMIIDLGPEILSRLNEWLNQTQLTNEEFICDQCMLLLLRSLDEQAKTSRQVGHQRVCVWCGKSILRVRSNALPVNTPERQLIEQKIAPRQLPEEPRVCFACWVAAKRNVQREALQDTSRTERSSPSTSDIKIQDPPMKRLGVSPSSSVTLPNYRRTPGTPNNCTYTGCQSKEKLRVPKQMRIRMLSEYKLYIPESARICTEHIRLLNWDEIINQTDFSHVFRPEQVEDMLNLQNNMQNTFKMDFEDVENWNEHHVHYWLGHSCQQINQIINECSSFRSLKNAKSVLCIYLMKLRTGDSNEKLGTLLQIPTTTLRRRLTKARDILLHEFKQISFNHQTLAELP